MRILVAPFKKEFLYSESVAQAMGAAFFVSTSTTLASKYFQGNLYSIYSLLKGIFIDFVVRVSLAFVLLPFLHFVLQLFKKEKGRSRFLFCGYFMSQTPFIHVLPVAIIAREAGDLLSEVAGNILFFAATTYAFVHSLVLFIGVLKENYFKPYS